MDPINKLRFYVIEYDFDFELFYGFLKSYSYNGASFNITKERSSELVSDFVEKTVSVETIQLADGSFTDLDIMVSTSLKFELKRVDGGKALLKIINSSKSVKNLIKAMERCLSAPVVIYKPKINIKDFYELLTSEGILSRYKCKKINISSLILGIDTVAKLELNSTGNAYQEFLELYSGRSYKLDKFCLTGRYQHQDVIVSISSSGLVTASESFEPQIESLLLHL